MILDIDRLWGVIYVFICCFVIKIIFVVIIYIFKDLFLEIKMLYFYILFCGCFIFIFFRI